MSTSSFIGWASSFLAVPKIFSIFLCIFWKRSSFTFLLEKISFIREKEVPSFLMVQERSCSSAIFLERLSFQKFEENINFPVFSWERSSFIFRLKKKIIFSGKISSFLMIQEISYSSAIFFWKDHLFRTFGNRKYRFSCSAPCLKMNLTGPNFEVFFFEIMLGIFGYFIKTSNNNQKVTY